MHRKPGSRPEPRPYEHWLFDRWCALNKRPDCPGFLPFKDFKRLAQAGELPGYAPSDFSAPASDTVPGGDAKAARPDQQREVPSSATPNPGSGDRQLGGRSDSGKTEEEYGAPLF